MARVGGGLHLDDRLGAGPTFLLLGEQAAVGAQADDVAAPVESAAGQRGERAVALGVVLEEAAQQLADRLAVLRERILAREPLDLGLVAPELHVVPPARHRLLDLLRREVGRRRPG